MASVALLVVALQLLKHNYYSCYTAPVIVCSVCAVCYKCALSTVYWGWWDRATGGNGAGCWSWHCSQPAERRWPAMPVRKALQCFKKYFSGATTVFLLRATCLSHFCWAQRFYTIIADCLMLVSKHWKAPEHEVLLLKPHGNKNHRAHVQCSPPNCFPSQGSHCLCSIQCKFWTWRMELIYFSWGITFENFVWIIMVELYGKIWLQGKLNWRIRGRFCLLPTRLFHKDQICKLHKVDSWFWGQ